MLNQKASMNWLWRRIAQNQRSENDVVGKDKRFEGVSDIHITTTSGASMKATNNVWKATAKAPLRLIARTSDSAARRCGCRSA